MKMIYKKQFNRHWHASFGRDDNHINSYIKLIINLIFRR